MASFNVWRIAARCLVRPRLIVLLLSAAWRFRRRGWYRSAPFLPLPSADYLRWRMQTAFGDAPAELSVQDLEAYLEWTAWMRKPHTSLARRRTWKHSSTN